MDLFKISRELTSNISSKYPDTHIPAPFFEGALKQFFEEEEKHGTVYNSSGCRGVIYINPLAFAKALKLLFTEGEQGCAKTITAEDVEKKFVLLIKFDGKLPPRKDLAVITRIMKMAGFQLSCNEDTVQLVTDLAERGTFSVYNHDVRDIYRLIRLEFYSS